MSLASLSGEQAGDIFLIEAESRAYKTANCSKNKSRFLPLCTLGRFFAKDSWGVEWLRLRAESGLGLNPALPAWSESTSCWLHRRMATGQAQLFLVEFLTASGLKSELGRVGTHSLKCTVLSWMSKGGEVLLEERRLLGHHLDPNARGPAVMKLRD